MDDQRRILQGGAVAVVGNTIAAVGKSDVVRSQLPDEAVRDLHGWLLMPGLVDCHVHLPQTLLRGCGDEVPLSVWMAERVFILEGNFDAETARVSTQLAILEMLKAGTTTFVETLILGRHDLGGLAETISETGIRAVLPRAISDGGSYHDQTPLHPGIVEDPDAALEDAITVAARWAGSEQIQIWIGPRSTGGISEGLIRRSVEIAREHGLGICQHYAATDHEEEYIRARYGCSQGAFLERVGMLGSDVVLVHGCKLRSEDVETLRATGTSVVHCPTGPAKMGNGVTPVHRLLTAGVNVGLGSDAAAANNGLDLIRDFKWVGYLQKLEHGDATVVPGEAIVEMATLGGARAVGWDQLTGSIEVGKRADLIVVQTDGVNWTPNLYPVSNLIYSTTGSDVDTVMIDGELVMEGREMTKLDEERILADARSAARDLYARAGVDVGGLWPVV